MQLGEERTDVNDERNGGDANDFLQRDIASLNLCESAAADKH